MIGINLGVGIGKRSKSYIVYDSFDRVDSITSLGNTNTGQAWQALRGTWGISNNQAYIVTGASGLQIIAVVDINTPNCNVSVKFSKVSSETRLVFRVKDADNYITLRSVSNGYSLRRYVNRAGTELAFWATTPKDGDVIEVKLSNNDITVYINGNQRMDISDTYNNTETKHGLGTYNTTPTDMFDNFKVE